MLTINSVESLSLKICGLISPILPPVSTRTTLLMKISSFQDNSKPGPTKAGRSPKQTFMIVSYLLDILYYLIIGFTPDSLQTDEYLSRAEPLIKGRMMYASRRLYDIIVDIYGDSEKEEDEANLIAELLQAFFQ